MAIPTITRLLFTSGLDASTQAGRSVCAVGLSLNDEWMAWGDCANNAGAVTPLTTQDAQASMERAVAPALVGRKLDGFRELAGIIQTLTETITREEPIPGPDAGAPATGISRRALLSGRIRAETPPPAPLPTRLATSEQPLHPALRYGLEQALLAAVALTQHRSMAEVLADEYGLPCPTATVPLHAQLDTDRPLASLPQPSPHIVSLGYTVPEGDPAEILGENGVILQRFLRAVKEKLVATPGWEHRPALHIDVRGGLGQLYGGETGKMLGALFGLEQAARPLPLRIENPIGHTDAGTSASLIVELQGYLRMRKMQVALAAGDIDSLDSARPLAQADAYALLNGSPARLGGLSQTAEAVLACHANGKRILLSAGPDDSARSLQVLGQAALGLGVDLVGASTRCAGVSLVYGEMGRALAEMGARG